MSNERRSNLVEIRDLLKGEMDKFKAINSEIYDNQSDFSKISDNYSKYSNEIDKSKNHITELKKREFFENLFVYIGFYFFFACVAFVLLKRFPVHKIIFFAGKMGYKITSKSASFTYNMFSNKTLNESTHVNNYPISSELFNITKKSITLNNITKSP